jgi:hypothetical protein
MEVWKMVGFEVFAVNDLNREILYEVSDFAVICPMSPT